MKNARSFGIGSATCVALILIFLGSAGLIAEASTPPCPSTFVATSATPHVDPDRTWVSLTVLFLGVGAALGVGVKVGRWTQMMTTTQNKIDVICEQRVRDAEQHKTDIQRLDERLDGQRNTMSVIQVQVAKLKNGG